MGLFNRKKKKKNSRDILITSVNPKSPISEQYRIIRTNIEFSGVDKEIKTIVCTSANPAEGKSTTIANLAVTFAQQGKKTLYVDSDLRKPSGHHIFGVENLQGLTTILTRKKEFKKTIQKTVEENLFVLSSGPIPPNPSELLGSNAMKDFIAEASQNFDMIVFDTPPVLAVADATILGRQVDGTLIVTKSHSTEKEQLANAKKLLEQTKNNIIGAVINGRSQKDMTYQYYYGNN